MASSERLCFRPTFYPNFLKTLESWHFRANETARPEVVWAIPQYGLGFPEEIPEKFRKDPGNALREFPGIPLESTAGIPQALQFKAFEASRAFPEFSPPQYGWGRLFFSEWNSQQYWGYF